MENNTDKWQKALNEKLIQVQHCQKNFKISSCLKCDKIFQCQLRQEYIKTVYESMNKGNSGGFEF